MNEVSGWFIGKVFWLDEEPGKKSDLVVRMDRILTEAAGDTDYLYPTEQEAWVAAKKQLLAKRQQALRDIASLSKPYIVDGTHYVDDPNKLAQWKADAAKALRITEQALRLCPE